jgi:hypothetical protein
MWTQQDEAITVATLGGVRSQKAEN